MEYVGVGRQLHRHQGLPGPAVRELAPDGLPAGQVGDVGLGGGGGEGEGGEEGGLGQQEGVRGESYHRHRHQHHKLQRTVSHHSQHRTGARTPESHHFNAMNNDCRLISAGSTYQQILQSISRLTRPEKYCRNLLSSEQSKQDSRRE